MLLSEITFEEMLEIARKDGEAEGRAEGQAETIVGLLNNGVSLELVSKIVQKSADDAKQLVKRFFPDYSFE
jgi:hypothetical protein